MMFFDKELTDIRKLIIDYYYNQTISVKNIQIQKTRKEFEGDYTVIIFPLISFSNKSLFETGKDVGDYLVKNLNYIESFNIVKGFLNLTFSDSFWCFMFNQYSLNKFSNKKQGQNIVVEFSSPNTNKPLHLGHMRNILLGHAISNILEADGNNVKRVQIINDRGIHICKSMLAWLKFGDNQTPCSQKIKGDHFVGKFYMKFDEEYKKQYTHLIEKGLHENNAKEESTLLKEAKEMLVSWENEDVHIRELWSKMNNWVYSGFEETYNRLGVSFDKIYYESDTYLVGKNYVKKGLRDGLLNTKEDGSISIDLSKENLDEKILLRSDGTSVYMTQDIGTAILRHDDFNFDKMIYVVGNEQNYHFNVLFNVLNKMGFNWAINLLHLSYGMVNLPSGKMKSREGTVVDIDELLNSMYKKAYDSMCESNKNKDNELDIDALSVMVGDAAIKYFVLKTDAKKNILFNPDESIDFNGHTGPFIQYTYARINSVLKRIEDFKTTHIINRPLIAEEKKIIRMMLDYPDVIHQSASSLNPSILANFVYNLAKDYNQFYQNISILNADNKNDVYFRLTLSKKVGEIIENSMNLLGIKVPLKM